MAVTEDKVHNHGILNYQHCNKFFIEYSVLNLYKSFNNVESLLI